MRKKERKEVRRDGKEKRMIEGKKEGVRVHRK